MVQLDGDEGLYNNQGVKAQRDLVQFVPFNKFQHKGPERLAQEVLEELPRQLVQYKKMVGLKPNDIEFEAMSQVGMNINILD